MGAREEDYGVSQASVMEGFGVLAFSALLPATGPKDVPWEGRKPFAYEKWLAASFASNGGRSRRKPKPGAKPQVLDGFGLFYPLCQ